MSFIGIDYTFIIIYLLLRLFCLELHVLREFFIFERHLSLIYTYCKKFSGDFMLL